MNRLPGGKNLIISIINALVEYITLLDNTILAKALTLKLHTIALKYSCRLG
jgi:hypothetical protein